MTLSFIYRQGPEQQNYTPSVATLAGTIVQLADGRAAVVKTDLAASELGSVYTEALGDALSASGTLFGVGDEVWWDSVNSLAIQPTPGVAGVYKLGTAVSAKVSGALFVTVDLNASNEGATRKVYEQLAASSAVTTTTVETVVATYTIPANSLRAGSVLEWFAQWIATATNSTDTFQFQIRIGGVSGSVIWNSGAIDLADNDTAVAHGRIVVRTNGASGTLVAASLGVSKTTVAKTVLGSTAIDTTVGTVTLVATITESVSSASNSARLDIFDVVQR